MREIKRKKKCTEKEMKRGGRQSDVKKKEDR
jgi:hypothetical protein